MSAVNTTGRPELVATELVAVVVAMRMGQPQVLTVGRADGVAALPSGPLRSEHRSLQSGLRAWVQQLTGHRLGFVEQLYTFADRERLGAHQRIISVSYLGLSGRLDPMPTGARTDALAPDWRPLYDFFPIEDRRRHGDGEPESELHASVTAALAPWASSAPAVSAERTERVASLFSGDNWAPEQALARYELAWEAGLVPESRGPGRRYSTLPSGLGAAMLHDHRRILATGLSRLRATIQYRPVVFELMPDEFTLRDLQNCVEAVCGTRLHTQNFRRLVLGQALVEPTGARETGTGGRPARLFRFRREVVGQRSVGLALPRVR